MGSLGTTAFLHAVILSKEQHMFPDCFLNPHTIMVVSTTSTLPIILKQKDLNFGVSKNKYNNKHNTAITNVVTAIPKTMQTPPLFVPFVFDFFRK